MRWSWLTRLFPFLRWFPMSADTVRADLIAGLTVSMVLIPQALADPQLPPVRRVRNHWMENCQD